MRFKQKRRSSGDASPGNHHWFIIFFVIYMLTTVATGGGVGTCRVVDMRVASGAMVGDTKDIVRHAEELGNQNVWDPSTWTNWKDAVVAACDTEPERPHIDNDPTIPWISYEWNNSLDFHRDTWREFKKCFDVCSVTSATLKITGDDAFQIRINENVVATVDEVTGIATWGPGDQTWRTIYTFDVKNFIRDGQNELNILLRNYDLDEPDDPTLVQNPTGITYKLEIQSQDSQAPTITVNSPIDGATYVFGMVSLPSYSATDNCDPNPTVSHTGYSTAVGTHTMVVTAVDKDGNVASVAVTYSVAVPTPPAAAIVCPPTPPYPPCCISSEWWTGGWIYVAFIGMVTILLLLAIVYMLSKIFVKREWEVWVKDEFYQIIISVAIMLLLILVLSAVCNVFITLAGKDPFDIAHTYLNGLVWDKTLNLATTAFQYSILCQLIAGYKVGGGYGVAWNPNAGLRAVAVCFDYIYVFFAGISASLMVQDIGLSIIQAFAFRIMLPLGILFRIFPFLRKAGAMLIALALGLYIVYPLCFVMNKMIVDTVIPQISLPTFQFYVEFFLMAFASPLIPLAFIPLYNLMNEAAFLIPQAVFLPTLNLVITLTFVKNAARILSQNFEEVFQ